MIGRFDVAVVGSGPSGSIAAERLVERGLRVAMLDVGHDDAALRDAVPDLPFSQLRASDAEQRRYFLGEDFEGVPTGAVRVGAQLTPPRRFTQRDTERWLPVRGESFEPMQSLALGGLGAAWGAASFTYDRAELERAGIFEPGFEAHYDAVAERIGVSAAATDDASEACFAGVEAAQPPLEIDSMAQSVWRTYAARREELRGRGLRLGRTPLAVLSRDRGERCANPYHDMDFWSEARRSIFRPRYLVEELDGRPGFQRVRGALVDSFRCDDEGVEVRARNPETGERIELRARRLLLCAGAINSARIALHSLGLHDRPAPILCNPYVYLPSLVPGMLGREAEDRRHSLSQLVALYTPSEDPQQQLVAQLYGYRSLLLFKLVKEMPLPPWAGLQVARLLQNALCIVGIHHADAPDAARTLRVRPPTGEVLPEVHFEHAVGSAERDARRGRERELARLLRRCGVFPFSRSAPGAASSIHYAGTLPCAGADASTRPDGRLRAAPQVYVGDSASWAFLPAKGLTFTLMANALRVAEHLRRDLASA